jgi:hypothetical protein
MNYFHERQPDHDVRVQRRQLPNSQSSKIAEDEAVMDDVLQLGSDSVVNIAHIQRVNMQLGKIS